MHHLAVDLQRPDPFGHHRNRLDEPAFAADPHPIPGGDALLLRQHFADFDELLGLGNRIQLAVLAPEVEMLGEPVTGAGVREVLGLAEGFPDRIEDPRRRIAGGFLVLRVQPMYSALI
eukprot:Opistho-2@1403